MTFSTLTFKKILKPIKIAFWNHRALHWVYYKLNIKFEKNLYKKSGWKVCSKLAGCLIFQHTFTLTLWYIMTIIWKIETIFIHIKALSTWKYSNFNWCFTFMYLHFKKCIEMYIKTCDSSMLCNEIKELIIADLWFKQYSWIQYIKAYLVGTFQKYSKCY
jgi:hypothetical protein